MYMYEGAKLQKMVENKVSKHLGVMWDFFFFRICLLEILLILNLGEKETDLRWRNFDILSLPV